MWEGGYLLAGGQSKWAYTRDELFVANWFVKYNPKFRTMNFDE